MIQSADDLSEGGFAVALCEGTFGSQGLGADVTVEGSAITALFSETQSRFLVTVQAEQVAAFEEKVTRCSENRNSDRWRRNRHQW